MAVMTQIAYQKKTFDRLLKWLQSNGYEAKQITLYSPNTQREIIRVNTDYDGLYPTKETLFAHEKIREHVNRMRCNLMTESHISKVCIDIAFI